MWTKIYLGVLAAALLTMIFLFFYAKSWLDSIGSPAAVIENYELYTNLGWNFLWITTAVLLILANILLWKTRRGWALWTTFAVFAVFSIAKYFWLDVMFADFKRSKGLIESGISGGVLAAVLFVVLFAVIIFFNQFIVLRMNEKMYPPPAPPKDAEEGGAENDPQAV